MKIVKPRLNIRHRINVDKVVEFYFDGKRYSGFEGDTLASALIANGVKLVGRSFKLHRPRGIFGFGREEVNGFVQLEQGEYAEPNARLTTIPLYQGLRAYSQNAWPTIRYDIAGVLGLFHKVLPASFYYKSMMWPSWHCYEGIVRRMAGLGKAPINPDPQHYHKRNCHCDIMICGAGPAGLSAALAAAQSGARVLLVDEQEQAGGSLLYEQFVINNQPAREWLEATLLTLAAADNVVLLSRATVTGYYEHNFLTVAERVTNHLGPDAPGHLPRERFWRVRAKHVILATGAIERPAVFPNNDRPGIMLASAVRHYVNQYGVCAGTNVVVVTNNDSAYQTALDLAGAGVTIAAIVDSRTQVDGYYQQAISEQGIVLYRGYVVKQTRGSKGVRDIAIARLSADGRHLGSPLQTIPCDLIAMSSGWTPTLHLFSQSGGKLVFDEEKSCFVPGINNQDVCVVGSAAGDFRLESCLRDGFKAGVAVAGTVGFEVIEDQLELLIDQPQEQPLQRQWFVPDAAKDTQWIDFQYDVKVADIELAARENFISVEHMKRYTTTGMCADQGKTSNVNALAVLAYATGRKISAVGTTTFRPPYHPTTIGTFVGRLTEQQYSPRLEMPAHEWHQANGAVFNDYGGWQRPDYYLKEHETEHQAIVREVHAARNTVTILEGSPLGKIEVRGPDAAEFLHRVYINNAKSLRPGHARYGLMLNENGSIIDDGVFVRIADDHYLVHTTSAGANSVYQMFEEWLQCEWLTLDVVVSNVTTQWATLTVSGPRARDVVEHINSEIDFSAADFPHMTFREGLYAGVPARITRASFTGELSYEISVAARYGLALWEQLISVGKAFGITPLGVESLIILRTEKGYLHIGADTDAQTVPEDIGWGGAIAKKQEDFIGKRSLSRSHCMGGGRLELVGFEAVNSAAEIPMGGHIVDAAKPKLPQQSQGFVTSACISPTLGRSIGLGLLKNGFSRKGQTLYIYSAGAAIQARVVAPVFYDPAGERLNV